MPSYNEQFPALGSECPARALDEFKQRSWRYHHPLTVEQLAFAARTAVVQKVGFYHGGDVLYELDGIHGMWHEECLVNPVKRRTRHSRSSTSKSVNMLEPFGRAVPTREI